MRETGDELQLHTCGHLGTVTCQSHPRVTQPAAHHHTSHSTRLGASKFPNGFREKERTRTRKPIFVSAHGLLSFLSFLRAFLHNAIKRNQVTPQRLNTTRYTTKQRPKTARHANKGWLKTTPSCVSATDATSHSHGRRSFLVVIAASRRHGNPRGGRNGDGGFPPDPP